MRKGGLEGALGDYEQYLMENGLSEQEARSVIQAEMESLGKSPPPRPMDPDILDQLPSNPADQARPR
jgi:hypothetical protein